MAELRVTNIRKEVSQDAQTLSADFVVGRRRKTVWFRTSGAVSNSADPFLPAALIPAMRRRWATVVDGNVSPLLLDGADAVQDIMSGWFPDLHKVVVQPTGSATYQDRPKRPAGVFFSGGVDSFYTLQQHRDVVSHLIFVHGFDIPLRFTRERERVAGLVRDLAETQELSLIEVETNLRQFGQPHVSWQRAYYGAALASVALLLEPRVSRVYLAGTNTTSQLRPEGSHPDIDPKWGNGAVEIIHDGLNASRFDKIRAIAEWPAALTHLRVCYQKNETAPNCGRCRKCLWTMMLLRAAGHLDRTTTFAVPLDMAALRLYPPKTTNEIDRFREAIALLETRDADPDFRSVLQEMLGSKGRQPFKGQFERIVARARNYLAHRLP